MANLALSKKSDTAKTSCSSSCGSTTTKQPLKRNDAAKYQFPGKLMDFLMYIEQQGLDYIISWVMGGRGFMIHDDGKNLVDILPKFFSQTKYRSLRRQLNMWHFQRIIEGPLKGAFINPFFQRGNREMLCYMSRQLNFDPVEFESALSKEQYRSSSLISAFKKPRGVVDLASSSSLPPLPFPTTSSQNNAMSLSNVMHILKSTSAAVPTPNVDSSSSSTTTFTSNAGGVDCQPASSSSLSSFALQQQLNLLQEHAELSQKVESVLSSTSTSTTEQQSHPNDGDIVSFAGKSFFYMDCNDKTLSSGAQQQQQEDHSLVGNVLDAIDSLNATSSENNVDSILNETIDLFEPNAIFRL